MSKNRVPTLCPECMRGSFSAYLVDDNNIIMTCLECGWGKTLLGPTKKERAKVVAAFRLEAPPSREPMEENLTAEVVILKGKKFLLIDGLIALPIWKLRERYMSAFTAFKKGE